MAILKDLLVTGNGGTTGTLGLGVSGEIKEGDYRAVDGDTLARATMYPPYKEIMFGSVNGDGITLPIPIDTVVMTTRAIVIRSLPYPGSGAIPTDNETRVPRYYQLYDSWDWLRNNDNISATNPLKIYVVQAVNFRTGTISGDAVTFSPVTPSMRCGNSAISGYNFNVMVVTNSTLIPESTSTVTWRCSFSGDVNVIMTAFTITNSGSTPMTIKNYTTIEEIGADGLLKYL